MIKLFVLLASVVNATPIRQQQSQYQQPPTDDELNFILIISLGMATGFFLLVFLSATLIALKKLFFNRIQLSNEEPGSLDDDLLEQENDLKALKELNPNEQELYFQAKEYIKLNNFDKFDLSFNQLKFINEKGVSAWEFKPNNEIIQLINVTNKNEIYFKFKKVESSIQTNLPIPNKKDIYYFESKIFELSDPLNTLISIGISSHPYPYFRLPGRHKFSISYDSNGDRRYNQSFALNSSDGLNIFPTLEKGDVVGIGFKKLSNSVFFTRNGKKLSESKIGGHIKFPKNLQLFPTIGSNNNCRVDVNFGQMGFVFIEANVKKWGFAPINGNQLPPPLYTKFNNDVLLDTSDLEDDLPPNFNELMATENQAKFSDNEEDDITLNTLNPETNGEYEAQEQEAESSNASASASANSNSSLSSHLNPDSNSNSPPNYDKLVQDGLKEAMDGL